jgi:hypothetical protein
VEKQEEDGPIIGGDDSGKLLPEKPLSFVHSLFKFFLCKPIVVNSLFNFYSDFISIQTSCSHIIHQSMKKELTNQCYLHLDADAVEVLNQLEKKG